MLSRREKRQSLRVKEPEWDVRAFARPTLPVTSDPKPGPVQATPLERTRRTSGEFRPCEEEGASLTEKGIQLFKQGQYSQAVEMFSEAIHYDPKDHRFFGNRSYCYWCLELCPSALSDAQRSIQLAPDWPKGYFRKGSALMGLKRYGEAEGAMQQVLKLDQDCEEASIELFNCKVLQLMDLGFEEGQSVLLLEKFTTVQAALGSPEADRDCLLLRRSPCPSLWVGNVTVDLTEKHIWDLFKTCGEIESIRVLHERFCAFVNFKNANMAAVALERLQGVELESTRLVIRYPDRWVQRTPPSPQRTNSIGLNTSSASQYASTGTRRMSPINGDECFFWRTTGCFYGDRCRFKHKPDQRGRDRKPWQP
ncbi:protein TOM71-like [Oncorhynchus tshawytscha]|uniref:protein TOM71-like n=1 Tax=Oncorhynchus tshawytscha TaxID=74940 RepID=UPI001C3C538D|nr:protein TOM71-like [Oncorhynchus tshawytscha]